MHCGGESVTVDLQACSERRAVSPTKNKMVDPCDLD